MIKQHAIHDALPIPEEKWIQLQNSFSDVINVVKNNHDIYLKQNQKLETLLVTGIQLNSDNPDIQNKQFILAEKELKDLFSNQTEDFRRLVMISSILIPVCTWALCKFVNL